MDPTYRGGYGSRFSHSCAPNCGTVSTVSNGKYTIGMYALRKIEYGEELTFDYCSITENEKEYKNSICLCGNMNCKGYYLGYCRKHNQVFGDACKNIIIDTASDNFLEANKMILLSGLSGLSAEDREVLDKASIRGSLLSGCAEWLKKWTALAVRKIIEERDGLLGKMPEILESFPHPEDKKMKEFELKLEINSLYEMRVSNLAISIDKSKNFLKESSEKENAPRDTAGIFGGRNKGGKSGMTVGDGYFSLDTTSPKLSKDASSDPDDPRNLLKGGPSESNGGSGKGVNGGTIGQCKFTLPKVSRNIEKVPDWNAPPIYLIDSNKIVDWLWRSKETSLRLTLLKILKSTLALSKDQFPDNLPHLKRLISICETLNLYEAVEKIRQEIFIGNSEQVPPTSHTEDQAQALLGISQTHDHLSPAERVWVKCRQIYAVLSVLIKDVQGNFMHPGLSDILHFWSLTTFLVSSQNYPSVIHNIRIRECDLTNFQKYLYCNQIDIQDEGREIYKKDKKYGCNYLWGQMVYWTKQTIDKPDASLSAGRRGTLTYPEIISSFFRTRAINRYEEKRDAKKRKKEELVAPDEIESGLEDKEAEKRDKKLGKGDGSPLWPFQNRQKWLSHLVTRPSDQWPLGDGWSYENKEKIYGSFMLDSVILKEIWPTMRADVVEGVDKGLGARFELIEKLLEMQERFWASLKAQK